MNGIIGTIGAPEEKKDSDSVTWLWIGLDILVLSWDTVMDGVSRCE